MALTNIFDMIKADRYTQDGRDKIIEAQKEVEDVRYKIGDISQKTGLRKTAEGWVDPKTGQKPKGTKKPNPQAGAEPNNDKWEKTTDYLGRDRISMKTPQGGKVSIYETDNPNQKNNRFRVDTGSHADYFNSMEEAKAFAEKHYGGSSESNGASAKTESKPTESKTKAPGAEPSEDMKTSKDPAILKKYKAETEEEKNEIKEIKRFMKRGSNLSEAIRAREAFYTNNPSEYKNEAGQAALSNIKTVFGVDIQKNSASNGARQTPEELREIGTKGAEFRSAKRDIGRSRSAEAEMTSSKPKTESKPAEEKATNNEDHAPRVLTGDCKVRIRK